ncbi:ankyrin-3-like isoform X1 [Neocloeon triangulifer]|uniref:ankyrin-3-like isoform X1 n=1 Tax=Neocloeon triangulifer TaxID=2078957 RepID=UPI00286F9C52|nr:ankyrin-3-like isoform X1 [Neocloeon triangulifer]
MEAIQEVLHFVASLVDYSRLGAENEYGNDALHFACFEGQLDDVKYLLGLNGFSVEKKGQDGRTALHFAAGKGHVTLAEFLLSKGADVNARDDECKTPLILAAFLSSTEMCRLLVDNGADLSAVNKYGDDALHVACLEGKIDNAIYFLGLNVFSVDKKGQSGRTALHHAAQNGHVAVSEILLSRGADVNICDNDNITPLIIAVRFSSREMCRFLVDNGADLSAEDNKGNDALHWACLQGKLEIAKYLLLELNCFGTEKKGELGRTALHHAVQHAHVAVAEFLLSNGADINARDNDNCTPLIFAAIVSSTEMCRFLVDKGADLSAVTKYGDDALHMACFRGNLDNVKYLLGLNGFSVEKKGQHGRSALHFAAVKGQVKVAEFLLSRGADVNACDDESKTPLILAAFLSSTEMCRFLVENGADLSAVNKYGDDAFHGACFACKLENAMYFMELNGFSVEKKGQLGRTALLHAAQNGHFVVAELLLSKGANVNARDDDNCTALIIASQLSSEDMCRFLVESGADLNAVNKYENDSLHLACFGGKLENAKYLLGLNSFNVEKKGQYGRTALHYAAEKGHIAVAEFLLSQGADINARDENNVTPLTLADKFSREEMCQFLLKNGARKTANNYLIEFFRNLMSCKF